MSGLVPLELSANGKRLLAEFVGQDTSVGFRVNPETGKVQALDARLRERLRGRRPDRRRPTVLGHTGGPDPDRAHNVVTMPYRGGKPTVLVRRASFPDWSR